MIALTVLVIAMMFMAHAIASSARLSRSNRLTALATEAARRQVEVLRGETLSQVFVRYDTVDADDPGGAGTAPGANFSVAGLDPVPGDPDGRPGEILFPVDSGAGGILREDVANAPLGMPRDLNLDGFINAANHSADYRILPVLVRVRWRGPSGAQQIEVRTILGGL